MSNWGAQLLQLAWFTPNARSLDASRMFVELFGRQPDQVQQNRVPTPSAPFLSFLSTVNGSVEYRVISQPARVDAYILVPENMSDPRAGIPILFNTDEHLTLLRRQVGAACGIVGDAIRLAFVLNLMEPMETGSAATRLINERIGGMIPFDDASDLSLQVNRRKALDALPQAQMNRLNRFSVVLIQQLNMAMPMGGALPSFDHPISVLDEFVAANHYIDVNTVPTGQSLTPEQQSHIWDELFTEALRIRQIGSLMALGDS